METAIFAGGCFWCMAPVFRNIKGVLDVVVGYTGGHETNPSYEQVCSETTGHREAAKVTFDPDIVSYETLLEAFWKSIDPFDAGGQHADRGESYTTAIFCTEKQRPLALKTRPEGSATLILPATTFYPAENYHQSYYKKNPIRYNLYKASRSL